MQVQRFTELDLLIDATASSLASLIGETQASASSGLHGDGVARLVLTGGTAGIALLRRLAQADLAERIDWTRVHVFFGDERNVPVTHPDSNEGQAREALLDAVGIPAENIHGFGLDGGDMERAAAQYAEAIHTFAPNGFDLHLLGMGGEGHINSLFPDTDAVREQTALVVTVTDSPKPPAQRVSLTLPAVRRAERVWFLVSGAEKAEAAAAVVAGKNPVAWPAAGARGVKETILFVTEDAAPPLT